MMLVDTKNIMSLTEANQNFSRVVKAVDDKGAVVISKNNIPRYVVIDIKHLEMFEEAKDGSVMDVARNVLHENLAAFRELAK
jgi:antitoxin Phd